MPLSTMRPLQACIALLCVCYAACQPTVTPTPGPSSLQDQVDQVKAEETTLLQQIVEEYSFIANLTGDIYSLKVWPLPTSFSE